MNLNLSAELFGVGFTLMLRQFITQQMERLSFFLLYLVSHFLRTWQLHVQSKQ